MNHGEVITLGGDAQGLTGSEPAALPTQFPSREEGGTVGYSKVSPKSTAYPSHVALGGTWSSPGTRAGTF